MRKYPIVSIIALFLLGAFAYAPPVYAQAITVAIEPNDVRNVAQGGSFHVDLVARNVPADIAGTGFGLFGFQALVTFDPAVLTVPTGGATFGSLWQTQIAAGCAFGSVTIAPTGDAVNAFITLFNIPGACPAGFPTGFSGTVGLIGINFNVDANNVETVIHIVPAPDTLLADVSGTAVAYTPDDGFFSNRVVVNNPPVLTVPGPQMLNEGTTASFMVTADDTTDSVSDTVTITASGVPSFASCPTASGTNSATMTCTLNPGELDDGVYTISFSASDGVNPPATGSVQVTVNEVNNFAPTVNAGADETLNEGATLTHSVTASDADRINGQPPTLSFSLSGSCATQGATINPSTGTVTWATDEMDDGVWTCTVTASDGALTGSDSFQVTVNEVNNFAPTVNAGADETLNEGATLTHSVTASDADRINGQPPTLSFSLSGSCATQGATINPSTGTVTWATDEMDDGVWTCTVTASDGALTGSDSFQVTVSEVPTDPSISAPATFSVTAGATDTVSATISDPDFVAGVAQSVSISGTPSTLGDAYTTCTSGSGAGTATASCTISPPASTPDGETFTISWTGPGATPRTTTVTIKGVINNPPVLTVPGPQTLNEGTMGYTFTITADDTTDTITDTVTITASGVPAFASCPTASGTNSATLTCTLSPGELDDGVYTISFSASDGVNLPVTGSVQVTVNEVNNFAPTVNAGADETLNEGATLTHSVTASDADRINGQPPTLSFSLSGSCATQGATINPSTGTVTWATDEMDDGVWTCTVTASDGALTGSDSFQVTVSEIDNFVPQITAPTSVTLLETEMTDVSATVTDNDVINGMGAAVSISGSPSVPTYATSFITCTSVSGQGTATASCHVMPTETDDGSASISWTGSASATTAITVNEVNVAPSINAGADETINETQKLTHPVTGTDPDIVMGSPQTLTFSLSGECQTAGATIDPTTGTVTWVTPLVTVDTTYTCTVTVSDGVASASDSFLVTVNDIVTHARLFRGKLSWTHHLNLDKSTLQVFTAKVQNDGDTPVFAFVSVQILKDTGEVDRLNSSAIYLTPGTFNLDVIITWDPPLTHGTVKYKLNATVYYVDATDLTTPPPIGAYPYTGWTPDPDSSKSGAFATVCDIACPLPP